MKFMLLRAFERSADSAEKDDETWYSLEALWRIRSASAAALALAPVSAAGSDDGDEARDMSDTARVFQAKGKDSRRCSGKCNERRMMYIRRGHTW